MSITKKSYGRLSTGQPVMEYTLENESGASIGVLDFGGILTHIRVPDRKGDQGDVNLGFEDVNIYADGCGYVGALVGRVGNRIGGAAFSLEGKEYILEKNDGENNLHGGPEGFSYRMWQATPESKEGADALALMLVSRDGDQGFPGRLEVKVTYTFDAANTLGIYYEAKTDKTTLCNLTHHAYFNLDGHGAGTVKDLELQVFADYVTEVDSGMIPTGKLLPCKELCYGFQKPTRIGDVLERKDAALQNAGGVDFNYCMGADRESKVCAELYSPKTGRLMTVVTDQPGVQIYTGQGMNRPGKENAYYAPFAGICLETQHYPDAIHQPQFSSIVLRPEDTYYSFTQYRFTVR